MKLEKKIAEGLFLSEFHGKYHSVFGIINMTTIKQ